MFTVEEKIHAVAMAPVGSHSLMLDSRVIQKPGWYQLITPSTRTEWLNEVLFSEIEESDADRVIAETLALYHAHGLRFKWCVGPWTRPLDMGERLTRAGFTHWDVRGMVCDPFTLKLRVPKDVRVEPLSKDNFETYLSTILAGWSMPEHQREAMRRILGEELFSTRGKRFSFLAYCDGKPAGTAGFQLKADATAYFQGGNVVTDLRGRGIYKALVEARLEALRELGVRLVTTQARDATSAPILERIGFETVFRSKVYLSA